MAKAEGELLGLEKVPSLEEVSRTIKGGEADIASRIKALFYARHIGGPEAVEALKGGLTHPSVLFRHEIAYVMGQFAHPSALDTLTALLKDETEHPMVRHEAGEAIAAIGDKEAIPLLESFLDCPLAPVRETCLLAVYSLRKAHGLLPPQFPSTLPPTAATTTSQQPQRAAATSGKCGDSDATAVSVPFYLYSCASTDPGIAGSGNDGNDQQPPVRPFTTIDPIKNVSITADVGKLRQQLLDEALPLPHRYEALFSLRNLSLKASPPSVASSAALDAIVESLRNDNSSALFRHEVAFVLGQLQSPSSLDALRETLEKEAEHPMARHEAALSLGSVLSTIPLSQTRRCLVEELSADTSQGGAKVATGLSGAEKALASLRHYVTHEDPIVAESCVVALDNLR